MPSALFIGIGIGISSQYNSIFLLIKIATISLRFIKRFVKKPFSGSNDILGADSIISEIIFHDKAINASCIKMVWKLHHIMHSTSIATWLLLLA
ncbi:hypothetical protein PQV03_07555 [Thermoanaerobacterium thermosaccharolyticum]|uniref:hypothetical protein n=1 Tax=Thermoanaerobacterium thermosaccharolyticum TaxID=1517 RepID=UPI003D266823